MTFYSADPNLRHEYFNKFALAESHLETEALPSTWASALFSVSSPAISKPLLLASLKNALAAKTGITEQYFCRKIPRTVQYFCFCVFKNRNACAQFCSEIYTMDLMGPTQYEQIQLRFSPVFSPLSRSILFESQVLLVGGTDSNSWHAELYDKITRALRIAPSSGTIYDKVKLGNPGDSMIQVLFCDSPDFASKIQKLGFVRVQGRIVSFLPVCGSFAYRTAAHSLLLHPIPTDVDVNLFEEFLRTLHPVPMYWRRVTPSPEHVWVHFSFPAYPHMFESVNFGPLNVQWHEYTSDYAKKLIVKPHAGFPWCVDSSIQDKIAIETIRLCDFTAIPKDAPSSGGGQVGMPSYQSSAFSNQSKNTSRPFTSYYSTIQYTVDAASIIPSPQIDKRFFFVTQRDSILRHLFPFYIPRKLQHVFAQTCLDPNTLSIRNTEVRALLQLPLIYSAENCDL